MTRGFVIAGSSSGVGKTTIALGLMTAFKKRGMTVQPFKVGPDYIDPAYHSVVSCYPSRNLDGWMLDQETNTRIFQQHTFGKDVAIIEGVMGLFDSSSGDSERGSTAQMAKWLGLPVILVIDGSKMARSAGAIIHGFEYYDPGLNLAGVIFNNVASKNHYNHLSQGVRKDSKVRLLGYLPRSEEIKIPERHLGLKMPEASLMEWQETLVSLVEAHIDIQAILSIALPLRHEFAGSSFLTRKKKIKVRLGIARDEAFCFYYPDNLEILEDAGGELAYFSPLRDKRLPEEIHGIYLGGGYPELYAKELEANKTLRKELKDAAEAGMPIYGECGGFMYLTRGVWTDHAQFFEMSGVFPLEVKMGKRLSSLGYCEGEVIGDSPFYHQGDPVRGHEFHYSSVVKEPLETRKIYQISKNGILRQEGYLNKNVLGSYIHLHFAGNRLFVERFIEACDRWRQTRLPGVLSL